MYPDYFGNPDSYRDRQHLNFLLCIEYEEDFFSFNFKHVLLARL